MSISERNQLLGLGVEEDKVKAIINQYSAFKRKRAIHKTKISISLDKLKNENEGGSLSDSFLHDRVTFINEQLQVIEKRGINISAFCKDFNNRTSIYKEGIPLPSKIKVNPDRSYDLTIYSPTSMYLLMQAAGIHRGTMQGKDIVGKITIKHIYEIAKVKHEDPSVKLFPLKRVCEMLVGTCRSIGIEVLRDIDPETYPAYLEERRAQVEREMAEIQEAKEAKLLRK